MKDDQLDSYMDTATELLGLPLEAGWRAGVRENLTAVLYQANLVAGFAFSDRAELAARYELPDR